MDKGKIEKVIRQCFKRWHSVGATNAEIYHIGWSSSYTFSNACCIEWRADQKTVFVTELDEVEFLRLRKSLIFNESVFEDIEALAGLSLRPSALRGYNNYVDNGNRRWHVSVEADCVGDTTIAIVFLN